MNLSIWTLLALCLYATVGLAQAEASPSLLGDTLQFFRDEWSKFRTKHNRTYTNLSEANKRFTIFVENVRSVLHHNQAFQQGNAPFEQHINLFADMTTAEVSKQRNGFNNTEALLQQSDAAATEDNSRSRSRRDLSGSQGLPDEVNWVTKGAVAPVLDQGSCGACYAFASAAAVEGLHFRQVGKLVQLAPQQLVDCSGAYGNMGCDGGIMQYAYKYVREKGGLTDLPGYPYVGHKQICHRIARRVETVGGMVQTKVGDELALKRAVATAGPVAVAIDGNQRSLHFYRGGVYLDNNCSAQVPNHAVLVVGYGTDRQTGLDYWLVKNSWGTEWGEKGYVRMARNRGNHCCITCNAVYPTA